MTLVAGATPVTGGGPVDIGITGTTITSVTPAAPAERRGGEWDLVLEAGDRLVLPGLVDAHVHTHDRFDRGRADDLPLEVWRTWYNPPGDGRAWTAEETYLRTLLAGAEVLQAGTTTVVDDLHLGASRSEATVAAVFRAYTDLGLRAEVSVAFSDLPFQADLPHADQVLPEDLRGRAATPAQTAAVLELWRALAAEHTGRVRFVLSPSAPLRCSRLFLEQVAALSEELDLPVLVHLLESRLQAVAAADQGIDSLVRHLADVGLLTSRAVLAHATWARQDEVEAIAGSGARVVHCPGSNLKLGSGVAPVRALLDVGVPVGLGTDNFSANDSASVLEQVKLAALVSRAAAGHPRTWVTAPEALAMATSAHTRAPGPADLLAPGRPADLVLLRRDADAFSPEHDLVNQLVFAASAAAVDTVLVDGRVAVAGGAVTTVDHDALRRELADRAAHLRRTIAEADRHGRALLPHLSRAFDLAHADFGTTTTDGGS